MRTLQTALKQPSLTEEPLTEAAPKPSTLKMVPVPEVAGPRLSPTTRQAVSSPDDTSQPLLDGMQRLKQACEKRRLASDRAQKVACNLAFSIAEMVAEANLAAVRLPRDYVANVSGGEAFLVKCKPGQGAYSQPEPLYILARPGSLVARLEPLARNLTQSEVGQFMQDVAEGLLDEIADFVEKTNSSDQAMISQLAHLLGTPTSTEPTQPAAPVAEAPAHTPAYKPRVFSPANKRRRPTPNPADTKLPLAG